MDVVLIISALFVMVLIFSLDFKFSIHHFKLATEQKVMSYLAVNRFYLCLL